MKFIIIASLAGCATIDQIQVYRSTLTIDRVETKYRDPITVYYAIWVDRRGIEYKELLTGANDTFYFKRGVTLAQLLKR